MKNIQFTSRETDLEILENLMAEIRAVLPILRVSVLVVLLAVLPAVLTGVLLSDTFQDALGMLHAEVILSILLPLLVWSILRLMRPIRYSRNWTVAEFTIVPIVGMMLMLAFNAWFLQIYLHSPYFLMTRQVIN